MVPIRVRRCPASRYYLKCPYSRTPSRIVVHNTANDAPAENEISYMLNNDDEVSYHVAVDDKEIIKAIPFDRNAWASGDGHGVGNMEGIHIEICYSLHGGPRFEKAERNAAEYIASLLKEYGWGMAQVTKHQDYDGKYCPHRTLDLGWGRFLKLVENFLKEEDDMTEEQVRKIAQEEFRKVEPTYNTLEQVPSWWRTEIEHLIKIGLIKGTGNGKLGLTYTRAWTGVLIYRAMKVIADEDPIYRTIDDVPEWGKPAVQSLIDSGKLSGEKIEADGTRILNLPRSDVRMIVTFLSNYIEDTGSEEEPVDTDVHE